MNDAERALAAANEAFSRFEIESVIAHLSVAFRASTAAGDVCGAAMACARLGDAFASGLGNLTAARAWFTRARRLIENEPPCVEQGWVAVAAMGCDVDDPSELLAAAELALDRARRFGDVNLETKALADGGLALVQAGSIQRGMAMLDEAMALACGPADDSDAAAKSVCSFFTACYHAADFGRARSWADVLRRSGLIGGGPGGPVFLSSHCDSVQATFLVELGRWSDAEAVLLRAKAEFESKMPLPSWHADIALADLRIRQGRFSDAEMLLLGKDQSLQALLPLARLHLARGDHALATAAANRGLRLVGDDRLRAAELLTIVVEASLQAGDVAAASAAADDLERRLAGLEAPALRARAASARARLAISSGDHRGAIATIEAATDDLDTAQLPWLHATLLVQLARLRDESGDRAGAVLDAKAASAALASLDVVVPAADAELLRRLTDAGPALDGSAVAQLVRDGRRWRIETGDSVARVADTKGMRYLAALLARPGVEQHALDLVDRVEGVDLRGLDRRRLGDAGELSDASARRAYRARVEQLRVDLDEALARERFDEAENVQRELDALIAELAAAFGMGGRGRKAASAAERARLNVTRAIRTAIVNVQDVAPAAGDALDRGVRTGMYCVYARADDDIRWVVADAAATSFLRV